MMWTRVRQEIMEILKVSLLSMLVFLAITAVVRLLLGPHGIGANWPRILDWRIWYFSVIPVIAYRGITHAGEPGSKVYIRRMTLTILLCLAAGGFFPIAVRGM